MTDSAKIPDRIVSIRTPAPRVLFYMPRLARASECESCHSERYYENKEAGTRKCRNCGHVSKV